MLKRKLSSEGKKEVCLQFFRDSNSFFERKELENRIPRETGIHQKQVKEVLQELLDSELICSGKVGQTLIYWLPYPKDSGAEEEKLKELKQELANIKENITSLEAAAEDTETQVLKTENVLLQSRLQQLEEQLKEEPDDSADVLDKAEKGSKWRDAANRWTDNVFCVKSWIKKKLSCDDSLIDKQFRIPSNFDYLE